MFLPGLERPPSRFLHITLTGLLASLPWSFPWRSAFHGTLSYLLNLFLLYALIKDNLIIQLCGFKPHLLMILSSLPSAQISLGLQSHTYFRPLISVNDLFIEQLLGAWEQKRQTRFNSTVSSFKCMFKNLIIFLFKSHFSSGISIWASPMCKTTSSNISKVKSWYTCDSSASFLN